MNPETVTLARPADPHVEQRRQIVFDRRNPRMRLMIACLVGTVLLAMALAVGGITALAVVGVLFGALVLSLREAVHIATHERRASRRG